MKKLCKIIGIILGVSAIISIIASFTLHCNKAHHKQEITERTYTTIE